MNAKPKHIVDLVIEQLFSSPQPFVADGALTSLSTSLASVHPSQVAHLPPLRVLYIVPGKEVMPSGK